MSTITTRAGKGSPLTNNEVDANFTNLNTDKAELSGAAFTGAITTTSTVDGRDVATDGTKLDGIEAGATADQTAAEIKTAYESNADTNAFTDADESKLDGIEAGADVTDTAAVTAAGALMDSELTSEASVKALNQGVATTDSPTFAGLTTSADISFGDNDKAVFGAGSDLQIYHDGTAGASYIDDVGTGRLYIRGSRVTLQKYTGETMIDAVGDGAVTLYHDNNAPKLATTSTGIDVTGKITVDSLGSIGVVATDRLYMATSDGLGIQLDKDNNRIVPVGADGSAYNNNVSLGSSGLEFKNLFLSGTATMDGLTVSSTTPVIDVLAGTNEDASLRLRESGTGIVGAEFTYDGGDNALYLKVGNNTDTKRLSVSRDTGDISFYEDTGTTAKFFWDASAESLGIGTSSPSKGLHLNFSNDYAAIRFQNTANAKVWDLTPSIPDVANSGFSLHNVTDNTIALHVDNSNNVGIGTSSPAIGGGRTYDVALTIDGGVSGGVEDTGALEVGGSTSVNDRLVGSISYFNRDNSGAGATTRRQVAIIEARSVTSDSNAGDDSGANLTFSTKSEGGSVAERMRIDSSGNLLVGTTNDTGTNAEGFLFYEGSGGSRLYIGHANGTANGTQYTVFNYNSTKIGDITQSGTTAVLYNTTSDERLKENITDANDAGSKIDAIQVRQYDWKADGSHQDYGMIAQELQTVAPEAVSGDADSEDMMGVDYSKLVPMLIKEIQSLRNRVAQLEE